jgi:hypothetical protein
MKNLFILSTPPHYYNLLQYIEQFEVNTKDSELLFLSSFFTPDKIMDDFINKYIDKSEWKSVRRISLWQTKFKKIYSPSNLFKIFLLLFNIFLFYSFRKYNHLVVNQVDQSYCKFFYIFVSFNKLIALDEGNDVFRISHNRIHNTKSNLFMPKKIIFFSSYKIDVKEPDILIECKNLYSKKIIKYRKINKNEIFFIGSPYLDDGLIEEDIYYKYIDKIRKDFENTNIKYFPHRRENEKNLSILKNNYNFLIQRIDIPIELYFLKINISPEVIIGFSSNALFSLKKLSNDNTLVRSYYITAKNLHSFSDELIQIKKQYKYAGIEVLDL